MGTSDDLVVPEPDDSDLPEAYRRAPSEPEKYKDEAGIERTTPTVKIVKAPPGHRRRKHSPEIVEYERTGEWLMRCWGCGARVWTGSQEEAQNAFRAHRLAPEDEILPRRVHAVAMVSDKGEKQIRMFDTAPDALAFIERSVGDRHWWGWSFMYLTGERSPKAMMERLAVGELPADV